MCFVILTVPIAGYAVGAPADEALRSGLTDLRNVSKHIEDAYRKELQAFKRKSRKK